MFNRFVDDDDDDDDCSCIGPSLLAELDLGDAFNSTWVGSVGV